MTLMDETKKGTDVSFNNGFVLWANAKRDKVRYAFIRFSQRGLYPIPDQEDWKDSERHNNWAGAKKEGILRAPYIVWDERDGHLAQGHIDGFLYAFAPYFGVDMPELPPVLDLEVYPITWDELKKFLEWLEMVFGVIPIIYSGSWVFQPYYQLPQWLKKYPYWLTGYNTIGPDLYGPLADLDPEVICWQQDSGWVVDWSPKLGIADRNYWITELWRYVKMPNKVVYADDILAYMQNQAFECEEAPIPPSPITGAFDIRYPFDGTYNVTNPFNTYSKWYAGIGGHEGIDWGMIVGEEILASHDGLVTVAGFRPEKGDSDIYGWQVRIEQEAKDWSGSVRKFTTCCAHLSDIGVAVGEYVKQGDPIGLSGGAEGHPGAGHSSGPHLHFMITSKDAYQRKETYLKFDFMNPWIWLTDLSTAPLHKYRVKDGVWLNVRNKAGLDSVVRFTMGPLSEFYGYVNKDVNGYPWVSQDVSRTAWNSIYPDYVEQIG